MCITATPLLQVHHPDAELISRQSSDTSSFGVEPDDKNTVTITMDDLTVERRWTFSHSDTALLGSGPASLSPPAVDGKASSDTEGDFLSASGRKRKGWFKRKMSKESGGDGALRSLAQSHSGNDVETSSSDIGPVQIEKHLRKLKPLKKSKKNKSKSATVDVESPVVGESVLRSSDLNPGLSYRDGGTAADAGSLPPNPVRRLRSKSTELLHAEPVETDPMRPFSGGCRGTQEGGQGTSAETAESPQNSEGKRHKSSGRFSSETTNFSVSESGKKSRKSVGKVAEVLTSLWKKIPRERPSDAQQKTVGEELEAEVLSMASSCDVELENERNERTFLQLSCDVQMLRAGSRTSELDVPEQRLAQSFSSVRSVMFPSESDSGDSGKDQVLNTVCDEPTGGMLVAHGHPQNSDSTTKMDVPDIKGSSSKVETSGATLEEKIRSLSQRLTQDDESDGEDDVFGEVEAPQGPCHYLPEDVIETDESEEDAADETSARDAQSGELDRSVARSGLAARKNVSDESRGSNTTQKAVDTSVVTGNSGQSTETNSQEETDEVDGCPASHGAMHSIVNCVLCFR